MKCSLNEKLMGFAEEYCCIVLFAAGLACSLILVDFPLNADDNAFYRELLDTVATTSAVIAGLLSVSSGNFQANTEKWLNDLLMKTDIIGKIHRYYRRAVSLGAYTSCMAFALILLLKKAPDHWTTPIVFHLFVGMGASSLAAYLRSLEIYGMISKAQENKAENERKKREEAMQEIRRRKEREAESYDEGEM